jgi:radical SAM superfamily enzyme YgiQ (UPF0313 family)
LRIAFLNPPFLPKYSRSQRSPGVIKSGTLYYPYWLAHATALCQSRGHEVLLCDAPADALAMPAIINRLDKFGANMVVIDTSTPSIEADRKTAEVIKQARPDAFVALCGTHVSALPEAATEGAAIDGVLVGEYDMTAASLADALENGEPVTHVAGLYLPQTGHTPDRALVENLDDLPWIAPIYKKFLDINNYYFSLASHPMVMLISGRGCPNQCFFCLYPQVMHGRRYRTRSPEHIVGEVEYIVSEMPKVREIVFEDDTFTADQNRTIEFCELMIRKNLRIPWFANVRVDTRPETLRAMAQAGFRSCAVGFESAGQDLLDAMGKNTALDQARQFMAQAKQLGVLVHGCFMVGFPGETQESMEKTLAYAIELAPDSAQFYPIFPYPGTEAYAWAKRDGLLRTNTFRDWLTESGGHAAVIDLPGLPANVLWDFCEKAYRRFHFRPKYLAKKLLQAIMHPVEGLRSIRSFLYYLRYLVFGGGR